MNIFKKYWTMTLLAILVLVVQIAYTRGIFTISLGGNNKHCGNGGYSDSSQREFRIMNVDYRGKDYLIFTRRGTTAFAVVPK